MRLRVLATLGLVLSCSVGTANSADTAFGDYWANGKFDALYRLCVKELDAANTEEENVRATQCAGVVAGSYNAYVHLSRLGAGIQLAEGGYYRIQAIEEGVTVSMLRDSLIKHAGDKLPNGTPFRLGSAGQVILLSWIADGYLKWVPDPSRGPKASN